MATIFGTHLDRVKTTVAATVIAGDGTITLTNAGAFGGTFPYHLLIWNRSLHADPADDANTEVIKVLSAAGNIVTVTRGARGTTAHGHAAGDAAVLTFMAGDLQDIEAAVNRLEVGTDITLTGTITDLPNTPEAPDELVVPMSTAISTATGGASNSFAFLTVQSLGYLVNGSPPAEGSIAWRMCYGTDCTRNLYVEACNLTGADAPNVTYQIVVRGIPA